MNESPFIHKELFCTICGDEIGSGMSRQAYVSPVLPDCVVKVEDRAGFFQNVIEWETWQKVKDTDAARWFAPCEWISPSGSVLIMKMTQPASAKQYPNKMPAFLTDFKRSNYGLYKGKLVCHDYGTNLMMEYGMKGRMRKVEWNN